MVPRPSLESLLLALGVPFGVPFGPQGATKRQKVTQKWQKNCQKSTNRENRATKPLSEDLGTVAGMPKAIGFKSNQIMFND